MGTLLTIALFACGESGRMSSSGRGGESGTGNASSGGASAGVGGTSAGTGGAPAGAAGEPAGTGGAEGGATGADCVDIRIPDAARARRKGFFRDANGLHVAVEHNQSILFRSYSPAGEVLHDWDVASVLPSAPYYVQRDVAGNAEGDFAIAFYASDQVTGFRDALLLGNTGRPGELSVWASPFDPAEMMVVELAWDGEAFAVHYVELTGAQQLSLVRLSPAGEIVSGPLQVGPPGSLLVLDSQYRTDPETGRSVRVTGIQVGVGVAGHDRDGAWLGTGPAGEFTAFITDPVNESYLGVPAAVSPGPEAILVAWNAQYFGLYFQFVDAGLRPLSSPELLPGEVLEKVSRYRTDEPLAAVPDGDRFYLFQKNQLGIDRLTVSTQGVLERATLVRNQGAECLESSEPCVRIWDLRSGSAHALRYEEELWLGYEETTRGEVFRVLRADSDCTYPSLWRPYEE